MSIEKIKDKIIQDATVEKDAILAQANKEAEEILAEAKSKAEDIVNKANARGKQAHDKELASKKAVAAIDGKNLTLEKKQEVIEECFDKAIEAIKNMPEDEYLEYLTGCGNVAGLTAGEVVLNAKDRETLGDKLVAKLNEGGKNFTLSEETKDIAGGLMIKVDRTYVNVSVDATLEELHDQLMVNVAQVLFSDQER